MRGRDEAFGERVVRWLVDMPAGDEARAFLDEAASEYAAVEARTAALASRYVVANPLRAGLVERIGDYPYWNAVWI